MPGDTFCAKCLEIVPAGVNHHRTNCKNTAHQDAKVSKGKYIFNFTSLVRTIWLRALCPKYQAFDQWAKLLKDQRSTVVGGARNRRLTPGEVLDSKGFPKDYPKENEDAAYRAAGNAVPIKYFR